MDLDKRIADVEKPRKVCALESRVSSDYLPRRVPLTVVIVKTAVKWSRQILPVI